MFSGVRGLKSYSENETKHFSKMKLIYLEVFLKIPLLGYMLRYKIHFNAGELIPIFGVLNF
jgi:hypothetical protein